jgi:hypothetical protein
LIEGARFRDRADGNFPKLVGGVKPKSDAVDLGHVFFALLRAAAAYQLVVCSAVLKPV